MASGFIGQIEISDTNFSGSNSSTNLSYTAPSSVQYSVVSISESASISLWENQGRDGSAVLTGFSVSASTGLTSSADPGVSDSETSNDIRLILGPSESVTIQGSVTTDNDEDVSYTKVAYSYTGSMSVLEVN